MKKLLCIACTIPALAASTQAANVALSTNGGVASHIGSTADNYGFVVGNANDGLFTTMNHTNGNEDSVLPDVLRIDFDASYSLVDIVVYNRGNHAGGSLANAQRLEGATIQAWNSSDAQVGSTGTVSASGLDSIHTFDNGGSGYADVAYITISNNDYLHITEFQANTAAVPEPSSAALLGLGGLALILRRRK